MTKILIPTLLACMIAGWGCTPSPQFRQNAVEIKKRELQSLGEEEQFSEAQLRDIGSFLTAVFGTPDKPVFPKLAEDELPEEALVRVTNLQAAAGPVSSLKDGTARGLYREHCVHCHGISGDGSGPTAAFLNPYPRDFRLGKYKYKSTPLYTPPTHDDLRRILVNGIPDTAMPSFRRLTDPEIDALVDYVKYLSMRGLTERDLLLILSEDPDPSLDLIASDLQLEQIDAAIEAAAEAGEEEPFPPLFSAADALDEVVLPQIENWLGSIDAVTEVPDRPAELEIGHPDRDVWVEKGKTLFFTTGTCAGCHGNLGLGDGQVDDYDDWTKDWMKELGIDPSDRAKIQEFVNLGAMPPRNLIPRNLRLASLRGGNRPVDLYLRIKNGIEGTPMPTAAVTLTSDDIWCLVEYVRQLPTEPLSQPVQPQPLNERALDRDLFAGRIWIDQVEAIPKCWSLGKEKLSVNRIWSLTLFAVPLLGTLMIVWAILGLWPLKGHWLPENVNEYGGVIDHLFEVILWITGVIFIGTGVVLAMTMWPAKDGQRTASYFHGNHTVEIVWAVIPAGILVFLSVYQINAWAENKMELPTRLEEGQPVPVPPVARVLARQYDWDFFFPGPDGEFSTVDDFMITGELHVPVGEPVVLQIESADVLHSFFVPALRVKQDVVPGMRQYIWFQANKVGAYEIVCTELCGWGHYKMMAMLHVDTVEDYQAWLAETAAEQSATTLEVVEP